MFSVVSICQSVCLQVGVPCDRSSPPPTTTWTCSNLLTWRPPDLFKLVYFGIPSPEPFGKWAVGLRLKSLLITTHKWSLGQGNVSTHVCLFTGGVPPGEGGSATGGSDLGGLHPGGLHQVGSASRGVGQTPRILWDTVNEWVVRILVECILVSIWFLSIILRVRDYKGIRPPLYMESVVIKQIRKWSVLHCDGFLYIVKR